MKLVNVLHPERKKTSWTPIKKKLFKAQLKYWVALILLGLILYGTWDLIFQEEPFHFVSPEAEARFITITQVEYRDRYLFPDHQLIAEYADIYNVRPALIHCIFQYEGGYDPGTTQYNYEAKNKLSSATGAGQIINGTWISWRRQMGENQDLSLRIDPSEMIHTTAWALAQGYAHHWEVVNKGLCK